jgi:hypothetical protein
MAIKTNKTRKRKKTSVRSRKTGIAAIDTSKGYKYFGYYVHADLDKKDQINVIKGYVKRTFNKAKAQAILKTEDYHFNKSHVAAYCYWSGLENVEPIPDDSHKYMTAYFNDLESKGSALLKEGRIEERKKAKVYTPSIQERMHEQLSDIIGQLEVWLDEQPTKDVPKFFDWLRETNVAQAHINKIRSYYEPVRAEYELLDKIPSAAKLEKMNEAEADQWLQLKENYSFLTKPDIKCYIAWFDTLMSDLEAYNNIKKAGRKARIKKTPSKEKLISKLKYKKGDIRFKIVSIDPAKILDATELWVFNTKTRKLGKYVAEPNMTFGIKGTTLLYYSEHSSVQKTLRKPEEKLKEFNGAGKVALRKFLDDINTVATKMGGRLNADTVILKAV